MVNWLDPAGAALRPDQVLNRALRPLLAMLRGDGIAAFYPGRDLVTVEGATVAHASFTVARDGVAVVEMHVAEAPVFARLPSLLDRFDPRGVAGVDRGGLGASTSIGEQTTPGRGDAEWAERFGAFAREAFACEVAAIEATNAGASVTAAHESAARDFLREPGPLEDDARSAATVSMLGVVECSGRMRGDQLEAIVEDEGPGLPAGREEEVFESFERGEGTPGRRGAGLGLAISRAIVQAHGGSIHAERCEGRGARFVVRLPIREAP
jgi:hypothetical protein